MIISSPYPWHYTLRWPLYYMWPSKRNRSNIKRLPDVNYFQNKSNKILRLLFCGDIMTLNKDIIPTLHPKLCSLIKSADYFIGNCESVVGSHALNENTKYGFIFHMPRDYLQGIIQQTELPASNWLLSTANNHAGDIDINAFIKNYIILQDMGVHALGQLNPNHPPIFIVEKKGLRIGFVAWTEWMNRDIFPELGPGVNQNKHIVKHDWRVIKSNLKLNYIFGLPHWEYEFQHFPHQQTRKLAKRLID